MRIRRTVSSLAAVALAATLVTVAAPSAPAGAAPAAAATTSCADPARGQSFPARSPGSLGFDATKLNAAVSFASRQASTSVRVYRHGCLAAKSGLDIVSERIPYPLASSSKGVASLVVGRAVTLGYVDLDAPISTYISGLDAKHGALTTRQILQQVTGLKFSWAADVAGYATDPTRQALALPFAHEPGTTYEYAQSILSVLATIVQNATGTEFLQFAQRELFDKVGIPRNHWVWVRDRSGKPLVAGGVAMRPESQARLGQLMLNEGTWSGRRVVDASYLRQAVTGTTANPGYGFLFWLNEGESYKTASLPEAHVTDHRFFPGSPTDTYSFVGALGQLIIVIPSRDIVIIRNGLPNKLDLEHPTEGFSAEFNREFKDIPRQVVLAVTDVPPVSPADSPYNHEPPGGIPDPASLGTLFDPALVLANLLGVGPNAGCNLLQCGTSSIVEQLAYIGGDTFTQVFNALLGSLIG